MIALLEKAKLDRKHGCTRANEGPKEAQEKENRGKGGPPAGGGGKGPLRAPQGP